MSTKLIMKVSKTVITEFQIDLDEWYSYDKMTDKEKHIQVSNCLDEAGPLLEDGGVEILDTVEDGEILEWELEQ